MIKLAGYVELMKSLPIFNGVNESQLEDLLKNAQVSNYRKNALLFLEGEKAINFYIILEGQIKLFTNDPDGQELILKIIRKQQNVSVSTLLLDPTFLTSAQIIDDSELLLIPINVLKQCLKTTPIFASNVVVNMATQYKELFYHLEDLTLKNVECRVGWFLLNSFLEDSRGNNSFELPYDKNLIASYLRMKPETFSRTLTHLKEEGYFTMDKNLITLSGPLAFCNFCNKETAQKCKLHNSENCLHKNF